MKIGILLTLLVALTLSCKKLNQIPNNTSHVDLTFTDIHTGKNIKSSITEVSPEISMKSGIYFNGPNYYLTKKISFKISVPKGEIFEVTLVFHKLEENPNLINQDSTTENWSYKNFDKNVPYYENHFNKIGLLTSESSGAGNYSSVNFNDVSSVVIDGVNKTKIEISLDLTKFVNSVYLPVVEQKGFYANGIITIFVD